MRGTQANLRSSELLEAHVEGYDGNVLELTYRWTSTLGTYLYIYNSHNMYSINNTDGEVEIYNSKVASSSNMSGRSYKDTFAGKGYAWASVYGANIGRTSLQGTVTVEVLDDNGNVLCSDSHTGTGTNNSRKGFVAYSIDADMDNVVLGLFEGEKRNVKDLLGESAIVHITCVESFVDNGKIISGSYHIVLTKESGDYYIAGTNAGTATDIDGDAKVQLVISKGNCKFHNEKSGDALTTAFVFKKPTTETTTTTLRLTGNLDNRCDYFIAGAQGEKLSDSTILFTGLTPNTDYEVMVRGKYIDNSNATKYAYAYVYDTTKPVYQATVHTLLDGKLTDIGQIHGEDVVLYLLEKNEDASIEDSKFIGLEHTSEGTYSATVENGIYYPWHDDGPEYHLAREYKLIVEHKNAELNLHHYSIVYDTNGGSFRLGEETDKLIYSSAAPVYASVNIPVREGYVFTGWKYDDKLVDSGELVTSGISAPIKLVAQWEKEVNVTINVSITHETDDGLDQMSTKDSLVVDFLEKSIDSDAFIETGHTLYFSKTGVKDENGYSMPFEYMPTYGYDSSDAKILKTTYTATGYTYSGLAESSVFGVALSKSGYDIGTIEKIRDEDGNWIINIPLTYNPSDFDLEFSVEMADDVPVELYPDAVIVKIAFWSTVSNQWEIFNNQQGQNPGIRINIDKSTGYGEASFPVWKHESDSTTPYGYRTVISGFIYDKSTIIVPVEKNLDERTVTYTDGNYTATMGHIDDGKVFGTILNGAYYKNETESQTGTLDAVITVEKYNVTFDAQGGFVNGYDKQVVSNQYYIPEFSDYQPVMEEHNFLGWYLDEECTIPAKEGALLVDDVTLYADWDKTLTGNVIVDGFYVQNGEVIKVSVNDRATKALVELEEITFDGTYNIDGKFVDILWDDSGLLGMSEDYKFTGLDSDKTYRIKIFIINYKSTYQNSTTVISDDGNIINDYNTADFRAVYDDSDRWNTFVNAFLEFEPEKYFQPVEIDTSRIGGGYRPETVLVEYTGRETGTDSEFSIITQHTVYPFGISVGMNNDGYNDGIHGYEVWKEIFNGNLYDYQANLTKINNTSVENWPVILVYGNPARYSPLNNAPTDSLKVTIIPKWYNIIYDLNTTSNDDDRETVFAAHIWSYETEIDYIPVREGYMFMGWYTDEACSDGCEITKVDASVHNDTIVYAKWQKRSDLNLTVNHIDKKITEILNSQIYDSQIFGEVFYADSFILDIPGYDYVSSSSENVVIGTDKNEITLYYDKASIGYRIEYYYDNVIDLSKTEYNNAVYQSIIVNYPNKGYGYIFGKAENYPLIIGVDESENVIRVYYYTDDIGGGSYGNESDGIPDIYQKTVIFSIENGTWASGNSDEIYTYVVLKTDGQWDINGSAALVVPSGMSANDGYGNGYWVVTPPETVKGLNTVIYTYVFVKNPEPDFPDVPVDPEIPDTPHVP